jgi:hypothetical protein
LIYEFEDKNNQEEKLQKNDWFYEIKYQQFTNEGNIISNFERFIRVKLTEIIHLLNLIKYSLPCLYGWHAMNNSNVVEPAGLA